ncbi:LURP1-related protein domain containing protein [Fagus crenata]
MSTASPRGEPTGTDPKELMKKIVAEHAVCAKTFPRCVGLGWFTNEEICTALANLASMVALQAKRKQSSSGVLLGDDVLTLVVEPHTDHSLIMALVIVYGLIRGRM